MMLAVATAYADNKVIGTVHFSLDGEEQTWYVLESLDGLKPSALWMDVGLSDGPGEIRLTSIKANKDAPSSFAGTFSGALKDGEGNARTVASGRFDFDQVEFSGRP